MICYWDERINKKVLRSGAGWGEQEGFIEDKTMSGKPRRRLAHTMVREQITLTLRLNQTEYKLFRKWYKETLLLGMYPFYFPEIDVIGGQDVVYQFAVNGVPKYSNPSGDLIDAQMTWEKV